MRKNKFYIMLMLIACIIIQTVPALAINTTTVAVNQSRVLTFNGIQRVAVANPEIADVGVVSGSELLLIGKAPGVTTVHIWTSQGRTSISVEVGTDDANIASAIKDTLGYTNIRVSKVNKTVILEGTVSDQYQRMRAEQVAGAYGEKVVNLLEITSPTQVKIEARVIEIKRDSTKNLGFQWGNSASGGTFLFGQSMVNNIWDAAGATRSNTLGDLGGILDINGTLNALQVNGNAKLLSQPNMITISGEKANILVGGEIPVPVAFESGKVTVEWKEYGIKLDIAPVVNKDGLITSKIKAEVSSLDWNSAHTIVLGGGLSMPPFLIRKAETVIAMSSGQTMAIGGLIASETSKDIRKIPLLGDIPILGKLFQSTSFQKGETELIILITPTIVDPATYTPPATDEMKEFTKENPWGGTKNEAKDKSTSRRR